MKYIILLLAITSAPLVAGPKQKTFVTNCDRVWSAVKRATAPPHYNFAMLDDAQKKENRFNRQQPFRQTEPGSVSFRERRKLHGLGGWRVFRVSSQRQRRSVQAD